ncbi:unnamed protein product [Allacma fusca]|uniref:Uncharacterized protein n=1 Tax=Allacma fusca TaxID=39272 RepID=A0A8J2JIE0_9HEXA|nr:unnamed protein product [Allacma fusca]
MQDNCRQYTSCRSCVEANCTWLHYLGKNAFSLCKSYGKKFPLEARNLISNNTKINGSCSNHPAETILGEYQTDSMDTMRTYSHHEREAYLEQFMMILGGG